MGLRQIAEMTNLSVATVSHALNGTRSVSKKNKQLVIEAAEKIGYRPNMAAKTLKTNKSRTIAQIIPRVAPGRTTNYFYLDIIAGANAFIEQNNYSSIIGTYSELPNEYDSPISANILKNKWVDGVLLVPNRMDRECIKQVEDTNVPLVLVDRKINDSNIDFVISDNENGTYKALELMFNKGRKRIAFVSTMLHTSASYDRYIGYRKFLNDFGLELDNNLIILNKEQSIECGMESARHAIEFGADAVFVTDTILTMGTFRYFKKNGILIPDEISLIGYDNYDWMEDLDPSLTVVAQKPYEMGYKAANILIDWLKNPDSHESKAYKLDTELICRKSH
jgi:LacI family transcriptional regulator